MPQLGAQCRPAPLRRSAREPLEFSGELSVWPWGLLDGPPGRPGWSIATRNQMHNLCIRIWRPLEGHMRRPESLDGGSWALSWGTWRRLGVQKRCEMRRSILHLKLEASQELHELSREPLAWAVGVLRATWGAQGGEKCCIRCINASES